MLPPRGQLRAPLLPTCGTDLFIVSDDFPAQALNCIRDHGVDLPPMTALRLHALARHGRTAEALIASRLARQPALANAWALSALDAEDVRTLLVAATAVAVADPPRAAELLVRAARHLNDRTADHHREIGDPLRRMWLLWAISQRTSLDASATRRIALQLVALEPCAPLVTLPGPGGFVATEDLVSVVRAMDDSESHGPPTEQGLRALRRAFIAAALPSTQRTFESALHTLPEQSAGGAREALRLHAIESALYERTEAEGHGAELLARLADQTTDPRERAILAFRHARFLGREPDPAPGDVEPERLDEDALYTRHLCAERHMPAARIAAARASRCRDPILRVAWHIRHVMLLQRCPSLPEAMRAAADGLRDAVERTPRPLPAVLAFAHELGLATALSAGDEDAVQALARTGSVSPLVADLLAATRCLAGCPDGLPDLFAFAERFPDLGLPLLAAAMAGDRAGRIPAALERREQATGALRTLRRACLLHSGTPIPPAPFDREDVHAHWLEAERALALSEPLARSPDEPSESAPREAAASRAAALLVSTGSDAAREAIHALAPDDALFAGLATLAGWDASAGNGAALRALETGCAHLEAGRWQEAAQAFADGVALAPDPDTRDRLLRFAEEARVLGGTAAEVSDAREQAPSTTGTPGNPPGDDLERLLRGGDREQLLQQLERRRTPLPGKFRTDLIADLATWQDAEQAGRALVALFDDAPANAEAPCAWLSEAVAATAHLHHRTAVAHRVVVAWMRSDPDHAPGFARGLKMLLEAGATLDPEVLLQYVRGDAATPARIRTLEELFAEAGLARSLAETLLVALPTLEDAPHVAAAVVRLLLGPADAPEDAREALAHSLSRYPNSAELHGLCADMALSRGAVPEAIASLEIAARHTPEPGERAMVYLRIGALLEDKLNQGEKALEQYLVSFVCDSGNSTTFDRLTKLYRRMGRTRDLIGVIDIAVDHARSTGNGAQPVADLLLQRAQQELEVLDDPERAAETILACLQEAPHERFFLDLLVQQIGPRLQDTERIGEAIARFATQNPSFVQPPGWAAFVRPADRPAPG